MLIPGAFLFSYCFSDPASAFSGCGGRPDIFQRILMQSDVFIHSLENNAAASFFLYFGVIFAF